MELTKNFIFFDQTNNEIKKLIKDQGDVVCQEKIGIDYINDRLKDFDFGFIRKLTQAQIGKIQEKKINEIIHSFVICKQLVNPLFKKIDIRLVCSRINSKNGKQLLELVENKAKEMKYQCLSLIAVGDKKLLNWYLSQGFTVETDKPIIDSKFKAYYMIKFLLN